MGRFKIHFTIVFPVMLFVASSFCSGQVLKDDVKPVQDTSVNYKDGTYEGKSRSIYINEPYWGSVKITLKNGSFTNISFTIRDSGLHETFDGNYEKHFQGNAVYIQQCRNDWIGVQKYPDKLSETQNINKVDAMSGATWSCNIFKASVKEALKNAEK
jgi:major membrane immunogen (membrane-anchored lipoprotein)